MSLPLKSQQDLYNLFIQVLQDNAPTLTDTLDGSTIDGLAGVFSLAGIELQRYNLIQFNKTFLDLANGPEVTGGPDDLQTLAVDHYGDAFARPGAVSAIDTETFERPNNTAGAVSILTGTIVKTPPDANGTAQRYSTQADVILTAAGVVTFTISSASVTTGAVYADSNSNHYTASGTIVSATSLSTTGTTLPPASGTLTKVSGTGASTLTYSAVSAPDCKVSVSIKASVAGADGNATAGTINVIESTLLDSTITCSNAGNATGSDAEGDATYRETIRNLIVALRAATKAAIESAAKSVSGVVVASAIEIESPVLFWNPATNAPLNPAVAGIYEYFLIPYVTLYIADATGSASGALIAAVEAAIDPVRAFGVNINVVAATPITIDWSLALTLNPTGPNFSTFSSDTSEIVASMNRYVATLGSGNDFIRSDADAAILAIWGAAGTNDLSSVNTTVPSGDVSIGTNQTAIPGTIKTV